MHYGVALLAVLLILIILWDAFETIILSRRVSRKFRITRLFYRTLWTPWKAVARLIPDGNRRENTLMIFGPLSLILLLATWAVGLVACFALLYWGTGSQMSSPDGLAGFRADLYVSGTTFFTLGLGDVTPRTSLTRALMVVESGMGFAFLAMVIGYLPLISQAFSRREVNISMLDSRAGSPPTAAQLVRRHGKDRIEDLANLLRDWERWCAELLESHVSFPVLAYFRSQHDNQSWVSSLTTILDSCAFVMARREEAVAHPASLTFAMARHAVVDLCAVFKLKPEPPPNDRLSPAERDRLDRFLTAAGIPMLTDPACLEKLTSLRAMYEPHAQALSRHLMMPLPGWVPPEGARDNWQSTPRAAAPARRGGL
jgi:ion channel